VAAPVEAHVAIHLEEVDPIEVMEQVQEVLVVDHIEVQEVALEDQVAVLIEVLEVALEAQEA